MWLTQYSVYIQTHPLFRAAFPGSKKRLNVRTGEVIGQST